MSVFFFSKSASSSAPPILATQIRKFLFGWALLCGIFISVSFFPRPDTAIPASNSLETDSSSKAEESPEPSTQTTEAPTPIAAEPALQTADAPEKNMTPELVYYNQRDSAWKDAAYGEDSIGGYGCGPTACAILISSLTDTIVTPKDMADWSVQNGCYIAGGGSYHILIPLACKSFGLSVQGCSIEEQDTVLEALKDGAYVGAIMGPGHFTESGHFIILTGVTQSGKITVADPASRENSKKTWDAETIFSEAKSYASGGGPFWIVRPKQQSR